MSGVFFVPRKEDAMNVFEAVKQNLTTRQAAEMYGIKVNRNGMAVCPFHNDRNPSMKVDKRFHCFACQADGDAVDFVSRLFGLPGKEAAMKLADDFSIPYDARRAYPGTEIPPGRKQMLQGAVRLLPSSQDMEAAIRTKAAGGRMASSVRGSSAKRKPYRISAGCSSVRHSR